MSSDAPAILATNVAEQYIAGGVVSLNRKVDPAIIFVRAVGSKLYDDTGKEYIDYHAAFAPHLLGHNDPAINRAVSEAMTAGQSLMGSGSTPWEVALARLICESVPSCERVQITNTGSEATAHAIRLARAWTGREHMIVTLGGYNGWHNEVARAVAPTLEQIGARVSPGEYEFIPLSAGIPASTKALIHVVNFNDLASVEYIMKKYPTACIITEPVLQNVGIVAPDADYLPGLRTLCNTHGAVLIFDEVKTGFRSALGGYQAIADVTPDLSVFGKAIANGYPLGVIGGKREMMALFHTDDAAKRVLIAGTYNAHPFTSAAAIATLERLRADDGAVYMYLDTLATRLGEGLGTLFQEAGIPATICRNASAFCVHFMDHAPSDWHDILAHHDFEFDKRYRRALIERGVYHFPVPCKQGSISAAHTIADIDRTLDITREVLQGLKCK